MSGEPETEEFKPPVAPAMSVAEARDLVQRAVDQCRRGEWDRGLDILHVVGESDVDPKQLPGTFYSYLGYGVAHRRKNTADGLKLCKRAIEIEFYNVENYFNLARTYWLTGNRGETVLAIEQGLKIDPDHTGLKELALEVGLRRPPALGFLDRSHWLNKFLGKIRHGFAGPVGS